MARILLTWELGSGFGHVASLAAIAGGLRRRGHEVVASLREPRRGESFFAPLGVRTLATPVLPASPLTVTPIATYADLLASVGFGQVDSLQEMVAGWDRIFAEVNPDAVVFDHSPFALLAAVGSRFGKLQHGTGFYIPPDTKPLPMLRPWLLRDLQEALDREAGVLSAVNQILKGRDQIPWERLGSLYSSCESWLATYEELDHFGARNGATYRGITPPPEGLQPDWPAVDGPRIFAYLQSDVTSLTIVRALAELGYPSIVRVAGASPSQEMPDSKSMHWVHQAVNVPRVADECDLAVLSGGHGTVAAVLLAGKPVLIAPIQFEQLLLAKRCEQLGLGAATPPAQVHHLKDFIARLLPGTHTREAAASFAERYRHQDLTQQMDSVVARIEQLAARP